MPRKCRTKEEDFSEDLKIVRLMGCDPYQRRDPDQKVVFMRLSYRDEIEPPMMLTMWDVRRLAMLINVALATHGDEVALKVLACR